MSGFDLVMSIQQLLSRFIYSFKLFFFNLFPKVKWVSSTYQTVCCLPSYHQNINLTSFKSHEASLLWTMFLFPSLPVLFPPFSFLMLKDYAKRAYAFSAYIYFLTNGNIMLLWFKGSSPPANEVLTHDISLSMKF